MSREIHTSHGNYELIEYEVDISQEMRDKALSFAARIKLDDNQFSRLLPANLQERTSDQILEIMKLEIQRTYVGKLGELAFLSLLTERQIPCDTTEMFEIYEGQQNTDRFDFLTRDGRTVDVKTGFRSNHTRLLVNIEQFNNQPKDFYVGVKLNALDVPGNNKLIYWDSVQTAIVKGYAEKDFLARLPFDDFGEGSAKNLRYNALLSIDRLIALF